MHEVVKREHDPKCTASFTFLARCVDGQFCAFGSSNAQSNSSGLIIITATSTGPAVAAIFVPPLRKSAPRASTLPALLSYTTASCHDSIFFL